MEKRDTFLSINTILHVKGEKSDLKKNNYKPSTMKRCMFLSSLTVSRLPVDNLTPEERDARTVFCMQLAARIRPRDLEDFFSAVGKVITDP